MLHIWLFMPVIVVVIAISFDVGGASFVVLNLVCTGCTIVLVEFTIPGSDGWLLIDVGVIVRATE